MLKKFALFPFFLIVFLIQIGGCTSSNLVNSSNNRVKKEICDTATFDYDQNDTTKVVFVSGVIFDTTACAIYGYILDKQTLKPIADATIYLNDNFVLHAAKTNQIGYFIIFNEIVCKASNWMISIFHDKYNCLEFKYSQKYGGVNLRVKLRRK